MLSPSTVSPGGRGGGGVGEGLPYRLGGVLVRNPEEVSRSFFCTHGLYFFPTLRGPNPKTTHKLICFFFLA